MSSLKGIAHEDVIELHGEILQKPQADQDSQKKKTNAATRRFKTLKMTLP